MNNDENFSLLKSALDDHGRGLLALRETQEKMWSITERLKNIQGNYSVEAKLERLDLQAQERTYVQLFKEQHNNLEVTAKRLISALDFFAENLINENFEFVLKDITSNKLGNILNV